MNDKVSLLRKLLQEWFEVKFADLNKLYKYFLRFLNKLNVKITNEALFCILYFIKVQKKIIIL